MNTLNYDNYLIGDFEAAENKSAILEFARNDIADELYDSGLTRDEAEESAQEASSDMVQNWINKKIADNFQPLEGE